MKKRREIRQAAKHPLQPPNQRSLPTKLLPSPFGGSRDVLPHALVRGLDPKAPRACAYLADHGPLALQEILLADCPTVGVRTGASFVQHGDAAQRLRPLEQFSYCVGYRHWWTDRLRSSVMYSAVYVDNLAIQAQTEYRRGQYVVANLAYKLFGRMDVGIEYNYGIRSNRDGVSGEANRLNLGFNYGL